MRRRLFRPIVGVLFMAFVFTSVASADGWFSRRDKHGTVKGSGNLVTETLDLDGFDRIDVGGVATVEIEVGREFSVELEAEDNIIDLVEVEVHRGTLSIEFDDDRDIRTDEGIQLRISMPELVELDLSGVYDVSAKGIDNEKLEIDAGGVGQVTLEGRTDELHVEKDGVGSVDLEKLIAQYAHVKAEGVGDVTVFVERELKAEANGIGSIAYYGNPERVHGETEGLGTVESAD